MQGRTIFNKWRVCYCGRSGAEKARKGNQMFKFLSWSVLLNPKVWASVLAMAQVIVKFLKELLTLVVNVLFPVIPDGKFEAVVIKVRAWVDKIDNILEKIKVGVLKIS